MLNVFIIMYNFITRSHKRCFRFPSKPCVLALKSKNEIDSFACFETRVHFYTDMPLRTLRNDTGGLNNFVQNNVIKFQIRIKEWEEIKYQIVCYTYRQIAYKVKITFRSKY